MLPLFLLCCCSREADLEVKGVVPTTDYARKLVATKADYPFKDGSPSSRGQFVAIFDTLLSELVSLGQDASEAQKIASFRKAGIALNDLYRKDHRLIETEEAANLVLLGNVIARATGLDPSKYGNGEGPISEGRDW